MKSRELLVAFHDKDPTQLAEHIEWCQKRIAAQDEIIKVAKKALQSSWPGETGMAMRAHHDEALAKISELEKGVEG